MGREKENDLEVILAKRGYRYAPDLEELYRRELEAYIGRIEEDAGGVLLETELDEMLEGFAAAGVIVKTEAPAEDPGAEPLPPAAEGGEDSVQTGAQPPEEGEDGPVILELACSGSAPAGEIFGRTGAFVLTEAGDGDLAGFFEYRSGGGAGRGEIIRRDIRFDGMVRFLARERAGVFLSGRLKDGRALVTGIHAGRNTEGTGLRKMQESFLQFSVMRLLTSRYHGEEPEIGHFNLSEPDEMEDYVQIAGCALPSHIRSWAEANLALLKNESISAEEKRHARRALQMMLNVRWESTFFPSIDPAAARRILDDSLYGLERVKQRVMETIIQINRTHTLPSYGLLLVGPAGTGKSQIAYAVARILGLPWASLDMSAIRDPEALTGSSRIYVNAKPGRIMESFVRAGSSNIVFVINELDKAGREERRGNPGDALLTLLDNLGFSDNYMECRVPTQGVYPIATANDKDAIPVPLLSRFALIELDDYTPEEKRMIFTRYCVPKVLERMGMRRDELVLMDDAVDYIIERFGGKPGCRELEQIAEHLAGNCLYRIETGEGAVPFDAALTRSILEG